MEAATAAIAVIDTAIQNLATLRASNGSEQVRLTFAADMLAINKNNLESANSRISDVDVASESANLAKLNILQQAGTAMLAQANMLDPVDPAPDFLIAGRRIKPTSGGESPPAAEWRTQ